MVSPRCGWELSPIPTKGSQMLRKLFITVPVALAASAALAGAATATPAVTVSPTVAPAPQTQGIIMSDGRICNPRWGC